MNRTLLLFAVTTALACSTEQETPTPAPDPAPAPAPQAPASAAPGAPSKDGSGPLSSYLPFVDIKANTSFANDRGMMTSVESVTVDGKEVEQAAVLAAIVAHWKGWSAAGSTSDEDVVKTTRAYVEAWDGLVREERVTSDEAPEELKALIAKNEGAPAYHPPKFEVTTVDGERLVVTTNWVKGYVGMRGRTWTYEVRAFRVKDGSVFEIKEGSTLPKKAWLNEMD
jgi:hypothetical protein